VIPPQREEGVGWAVVEREQKVFQAAKGVTAGMAAETVAVVGSTAQRDVAVATPVMAAATSEVREERVGAD
jgi:hypothetical protein